MTTQLGYAQSQDNTLILEGIRWETFEQLATILQDVEGTKLVYLDGDLEIRMSPSKAHEEAKSTIGLLLEAYLRAKHIRFYATGSVTLGQKDTLGRKEPDESYTLYRKKDIPDLVVEVVITSGSLNILEIYRRISIPEVWFYQDETLMVYSLSNDQYLKVNHSPLLPELNLEHFTQYVRYSDQYDAVTEFIESLD
jgi:Uma2 family endonuclease